MKDYIFEMVMMILMVIIMFTISVFILKSLHDSDYYGNREACESIGGTFSYEQGISGIYTTCTLNKTPSK